MWELIRKNQRKSLLLLFVMAAVLLLLGFVIGMAVDPQAGPAGLVLAAIIYLILLMMAFSQGKSIMLRMSNAREIQKEDHPQLYNIVEEMRLAAGMPAMPKVYIIDDPAPNAFAAGMNPSKSVVAVTSGLLGMMSRDELQGVVAHEISHILNRDIRYMTLATIMVGTVAILSHMFLRSVFYSGGRMMAGGGGGSRKKGNPVMAIVALAFAILAPIAIRLLYFSVSRKREYLADASAARLTRYPEGLASALEKISGSTQDLRVADKSMAPMYIANPLKPKGQRIRNLSSTHPPLDMRIRILRSMGKDHDYSGYQQAYQSVTGSAQGVIPASAMKK